MHHPGSSPDDWEKQQHPPRTTPLLKKRASSSFHNYQPPRRVSCLSLLHRLSALTNEPSLSTVAIRRKHLSRSCCSLSLSLSVSLKYTIPSTTPSSSSPIITGGLRFYAIARRCVPSLTIEVRQCTVQVTGSTRTHHNTPG